MKRKQMKAVLLSGGFALSLVACKKSDTPPPVVSISSFTEHAPGGGAIEILGTGFSDVLANNHVFINGVEAVVTSANATSLTAIVPPRAGDGLVSVTVSGTPANSGSKLFSYDWIGKASEIVFNSNENYFWALMDVSVDKQGNMICTDVTFNRLRKVSPSGAVSAYAGDEEWGPAQGSGYADGESSLARFRAPLGTTMDAAGNLYVADAGNNRIRKIGADKIVSTVASTFSFNRPSAVASDAAGNLYVSDMGNKRVCKINTAGDVAIVAGAGSGNSTGDLLNQPVGIAVDKAGNLYVSDGANGNIYKIKADGSYTTLVEKLAPNSPMLSYDLAVDKDDNLYIADAYHERILKIGAAGRMITLEGANVGYPTGLFVDGSGIVYSADVGHNKLFKIEQE